MDKINLNGINYVRETDVHHDVIRTKEYKDLHDLAEYIISEIDRLEYDAREMYDNLKEEGGHSTVLKVKVICGQ